eukprot:TRINITY_DN1725_c0_g1_i1.p1 TRINITY_DN1725_c0_g1~~TRINITY_DN1725_c0_g1_i1.p1  ORF type:complete len:446 (-),score=156.25 TRINITY_DN1725_c0_g1_i1:131-1468(-)
MDRNKGQPLRLEIKPLYGIVGPFIIGSSISEVIAQIRENSHIFLKADFKYNEKDPLSTGMIIDLVTNGIELRFDARSQRLEIVRLYDLKRVELLYSGQTLSSAWAQPSVYQISKVFGPSIPGTYDQQQTLFKLSFPGICFTFPIPEARRQSEEVKNGKMPVFEDVKVGAVYVSSFQQRKEDDEKKELQMSKELAPVTSVLSLWEVWVIPSQGMWLQRAGGLGNSLGGGSEDGSDTDSKNNSVGAVSARTLTFGSSPQDVLVALGPPDQIFYKLHDPMRIHRPVAVPVPGRGRVIEERLLNDEYFYNYFRLGFDILFDGEEHVIKKFVLHTNYPTDPHFNQYARCNYRVIVPENYLGEKEPRDLDEDPANQQQEEELDLDKAVNTLNPDMKWSEVKQFFGPAPEQPLIFIETEGSPYGTLKYYPYKDIIFEVMENDYIASVTLFKS